MFSSVWYESERRHTVLISLFLDYAVSWVKTGLSHVDLSSPQKSYSAGLKDKHILCPKPAGFGLQVPVENGEEKYSPGTPL